MSRTAENRAANPILIDFKTRLRGSETKKLVHYTHAAWSIVIAKQSRHVF